ncbi:acetylserotonin O-methyltransferase isoform X2 [Oryctolagus cuniculus]|uniref:acetylserotonin O-methyltransferase isoform X2 n=1 Tax=Oryctolagus cuniculus TaxID=9986 RepID=UPI003879B3E4
MAAEQLEEYARGFMVSQVLFASCELAVFDALAGGPQPAEVVAARVRGSVRATRLLLDAAAALGLLQVHAGSGGALYANSPAAAAHLTRAGPDSQRRLLGYLGGDAYRCWAHLADAVREGRSQHARAVGVASEDPFGAIFRSESARRRFLEAMEDAWGARGRSLLSALGPAAWPRVCDLGGGTGALARLWAELHPGSHVTVLERPEVVAAAQDGGRVSFRAGDFFADALPPADLYVLARVLHDWDDADCARLLARVRAAGGPGAQVLVLEALLDDDGRGPLPVLLSALTMLVQTRGRERSAPEYRALLAAAGFHGFRCVRPGGPLAAMLAGGALEETTGSGSAPTGSQPAPTGSESAPTGSEPAPTGSDSSPTGSEPAPTGSEPDMRGSDPALTGSEPALQDVTITDSK